MAAYNGHQTGHFIAAIAVAPVALFGTGPFDRLFNRLQIRRKSSEYRFPD